jgi:hypothetical protein
MLQRDQQEKIVQTDSGVHPTSYPVGTGGSFPGGKAVGARSWPTTHLQLVPRSRKCGSIHPLPIRLHGVVLNSLSTGTTLPSYLYYYYYYWVRLGPLGTAATIGLLYQPQMTDDGDCGAAGGMKIGRGNRSTRRKSAPAPLCPPQIPHDQIRARTRPSAVGNRRLTAWAMARLSFNIALSRVFFQLVSFHKIYLPMFLPCVVQVRHILADTANLHHVTENKTDSYLL